MTDHELLMYAARAAEIEYHGHVDKVTDYDSPHFGSPAIRAYFYHQYWNPLNDDGEAFRLAVRLGFDLNRWAVTIYAGIRTKDMVEQEIATDPYAATRRAIVRAAAEIGRKQ